MGTAIGGFRQGLRCAWRSPFLVRDQRALMPVADEDHLDIHALLAQVRWPAVRMMKAAWMLSFLNASAISAKDANFTASKWTLRRHCPARRGPAGGPPDW
jgi:hypothetical protein